MRFQLIACNGLYQEFCRAAALAAPQLDVSFLPPPCCGGSTALQEQIDQIDSMDRTETPIDAILIGCGLCGIGEEGIVSRRYPMVVPRAHDCAALLLGSPRRYREVFEENGGEIAFYAPELAQQKLLGAVNRLPAGVSTLGCLLPENAPRERLAAKALAQAHQLRYREYIRDNAMITGLVSGQWDPALFLTLNPGERCLPSFTGEILTKI